MIEKIKDLLKLPGAGPVAAAIIAGASGILTTYLTGKIIPLRLIEIIVIFLCAWGIFSLWKLKGQGYGIMCSIVLLVSLAAYQAWLPFEKPLDAMLPVENIAGGIVTETPPPVSAVQPEEQALVVIPKITESIKSTPQTSAAEKPAQQSSRSPWQEIKALPGEVTAFAVDPAQSNIVYAGIRSGGVFRSRDGGITWTDQSNGLPFEIVQAVGISQGLQPVLYAFLSYSGRVYQSLDQAETWELISETGSDSHFTEFAASTANPDHIYVIYKGKSLTASRDAGYLWEYLSEGIPTDLFGTWILCLETDPKNPDVLYAGVGNLTGSGRGVYKSVDQGENWTPSNQEMGGVKITTIRVHPADANIVYAGGNNGQLFKSEDAGQTWQDLSENLQSVLTFGTNEVYRIYLAPDQPEHIYLLLGQQGLVLSKDGGTKWRTFNLPPDVVFDPSSAVLFFLEKPVLLFSTFHDGNWRIEVTP
jgi:photosystem II stability/assembly factor-like uncharacterized protein